MKGDVRKNRERPLERKKQKTWEKRNKRDLVKGMKKRQSLLFLSPEEFFNQVNFALNGR